MQEHRTRTGRTTSLAPIEPDRYRDRAPRHKQQWDRVRCDVLFQRDCAARSQCRDDERPQGRPCATGRNRCRGRRAAKTGCSSRRGRQIPVDGLAGTLHSAMIQPRTWLRSQDRRVFGRKGEAVKLFVQAVEQGRTLIPAIANFWRGDGELVAVAQVTYMRLT